MASSKEYLDYILDQLSPADEVSYRAMMGEYLLYCRGKLIGGIYDDRLLIKPVKSAKAYMPEATFEPAAAEEPAPAPAGAVPQIFTVPRRMTAPACPAVEPAAATEEPAPAAAGAVPQIFTVSRRMTAPACPAAKE